MKFEIGDKVIILDKMSLDWIINPYYWESCIKVKTVFDADEKYFSFKFKLESPLPGMQDYDVFFQSSGISKFGRIKAFHKIKDKEEIDSIINSVFEGYDKERESNDARTIKKLEESITSSKNEIERIKNGEANTTTKLVKYNDSEFKIMIKKFIEQKLK